MGPIQGTKTDVMLDARLLADRPTRDVVNNAGCNLPGSTLESPLENIEKQFSANVFAAIHMVRATLPHMPPGGRIINVSTVGSKLGIKSLPFYNASKAASDSLTFTWAAEVSLCVGESRVHLSASIPSLGV